MAKNFPLSRSVYFTTNISCNLRCIYCYEQDKTCSDTFDIEQAKKTLSEVLSTKTERGTLVNFHGGEPFISFKKIKELCEWSWAQNYPEKFTFFATSNGTLIHGEIQEWLSLHRNQFIVSLSLDGTKEMQDINRSNSFDKIDIDFFVRTWPQQGVKMTISPLTINTLADGIIFIHEKGFTDIRANLAEMTDWSDSKFISIYKRELGKLTDYYLTHPNIEPCSLYNIFFSALINKTKKKWCGAGTEMEAIDIDGRRYPCHLFFESVCGKEKSLKAASLNFNDYNEYTSAHCQACPLVYICPTCYGSNYIARDNIGNRDLVLCELHKIRFAEVAKYQYAKIVNDETNISTLSNDEKYKRLRILEGIEELSKILKLEE